MHKSVLLSKRIKQPKKKIMQTIKNFLQLAWEYRSITLTVVLILLIFFLIIHFSNKRYIYIDCKVTVKKENGSQSIYYHCTRWNPILKNGYVRKEPTAMWTELTKRERAIIRKAHDEGKIPELILQ